MKNFKLYSCTAIIAVSSMFTSCMEQDNKRSGATFGIISTTEDITGRPYARTAVGYITNPSFETKTTGEYCFFAYEIDFDNQPPGQENYAEAVVSEYSVVKKGEADDSSTDNDSTYLPDPKEVSFSGIAANAFIDNTIFFGCNFKKAEGQINSYELLYNVDSVKTENDVIRVYKILFTGTRDKTADADTQSGEFIAFDISRLVQDVKNNYNGSNNYTSFKLEISFIDKITKDGDKTTTEWEKVVTPEIPVLVKEAE